MKYRKIWVTAPWITYYCLKNKPLKNQNIWIIDKTKIREKYPCKKSIGNQCAKLNPRETLKKWLAKIYPRQKLLYLRCLIVCKIAFCSKFPDIPLKAGRVTRRQANGQAFCVSRKSNKRINTPIHGFTISFSFRKLHVFY